MADLSKSRIRGIASTRLDENYGVAISTNAKTFLRCFCRFRVATGMDTLDLILGTLKERDLVAELLRACLEHRSLGIGHERSGFC